MGEDIRIGMPSSSVAAIKSALQGYTVTQMDGGIKAWGHNQNAGHVGWPARFRRTLLCAISMQFCGGAADAARFRRLQSGKERCDAYALAVVD
jgi:hypothetical protein